MTYAVRYAKAALKSLQTLDRPIAATLYAWVGKTSSAVQTRASTERR